MRKDRSIEQCGLAVKALRRGGSFECRSRAERSRVLTTATTLCRMGYVDFQVHSRDNHDGTFTIYRLG